MDINEIVVISGKGGTGKTTLTASLVPYFKDVVIADCDVDAPDLKILFEGETKITEGFVGMKKAIVDEALCIKCGKCYEKCKFGAIDTEININIPKCEGCGVCEFICPVSAIKMEDAVVGDLFVSDTNYGTMVHAKLIPGEETSGKLVSQVRKRAKQIAKEQGKNTILVDGSPGVACNVISSITGAKKVIIVTEPTLSGLHDLERVYKVSQKFRLKALVVVNKYDLSMEMTAKIEEYCKQNSIEMAFKIPFDRRIVKAVVDKKIPSIAENKFFEKLEFQNFVEKL